jgi:L1 cell adhesion molecule like protein
MILGVDFGTSNSCCSYFDGDRSKIIINEYGNEIYPTCIAFNKYLDEILYSNSAYDLILNDDFTVIRNIKSLIGSKDRIIEIMYNNTSKLFTVDEIVVLYLKYLKNISENFTNDVVKDIVITVPAYFSDIQRKIIRECSELAELNVIRIINEPTSAILAYCWQSLNKGVRTNNILVIDSGGGTTDYSIINADFGENLFEVVNIYGDNDLGGNNLTDNLYNYVLNEIYLKYKEYPNERKKLKIWNICDSLKCRLSFNEKELIFIENVVDGCDFSMVISRSKFYYINKKVFDKIRGDIIRVTENKTIDEIILVGGSSRIPLFVDICKELFGGKISISSKIKGDTIVGIGAGIQGFILSDYEKSDQQDLVLMDVTPMSLGVKTYDNKMSIIISKNTLIPVSRTQIFTNSENVDTLTVEIYQGDNQYVKDNIFLQELNVSCNRIDRGNMRIAVTFTINVDGILSVSVKDVLNDDKENEIIVKEYKNDISEDVIGLNLDFLDIGTLEKNY